MELVTAVIPSIGTKELYRAVKSVLLQTEKTKVLVVCDGQAYEEKLKEIIKDFLPQVQLLVLPENTGAKKFNGHRIYAAASFLVNTPYIAYLDEDNSWDKEHVEHCLDRIRQDDLDWVYALRRINFGDGSCIDDDSESIGPYSEFSFVDTSSYFLKISAANVIAAAFYGNHLFQDRIYFRQINHFFPRYASTGKVTVNYFLEPLERSKREKKMFIKSNQTNLNNFDGSPPWRLAWQPLIERGLSQRDYDLAMQVLANKGKRK